MIRVLRGLAEFRRRYFAMDLATLCWLAMIVALFFLVILNASPPYRMV